MNSDPLAPVAAYEDVYDDGPGPEEPAGPRLTFRPAASIVPTRPEWLWERWLCAGALHLLVGRQGHGKTTFSAWVVGNLTGGRLFPGATAARGPLSCAMLSLEESGDRQVARLRAVGADVDRVMVLGDVEDVDPDGRRYRRPWRLPQDCGVLERFLVEHGVSLVVVDGLGYSVAGDSHNYGNVGQALSALAGVAERTGAAILGLTHPPKGGSDPVTSAIGSTAWTAVARVVWLLGLDPDDDHQRRRVVQVAKSNFRMPETGISFTISDNERWECGYVDGLGSSTVTAEALAAASVPPEERTEREEARQVVRSILRDGPIDTAELVKLTRAAGLSDRTVERARRDLGAVAQRRNDPTTGKVVGWTVALPDQTPTTPPPTPPPTLSGGLGGLGGVGVTSTLPESPQAHTAHTAHSTAGGLDTIANPEPF